MMPLPDSLLSPTPMRGAPTGTAPLSRFFMNLSPDNPSIPAYRQEIGPHLLAQQRHFVTYGPGPGGEPALIVAAPFTRFAPKITK